MTSQPRISSHSPRRTISPGRQYVEVTPLCAREQKHGKKQLQIIISGNHKNAEKMFNEPDIKIVVDMEVADWGATGNFVLLGTNVSEMKIRKKTLIINIPDGTQLKSTHTCEIDVPWLPKEARRAHIVPGMAHTSLISIKVLTDAGCKVVYDKHE